MLVEINFFKARFIRRRSVELASNLDGGIFAQRKSNRNEI